ncbi:MAG TPA: sulfite exporter TauE/SafE family protein [Frankiaceae bacterium]|nr:sulfite exporter TauE/SafE family protein [Frankiaceae bacterium]
MSVDPWMSVAGLVVGLVVGLTGMGGGALMTPLLVLVFGVQPLAAVSSDLVASTVMKPVGSAVHLRRGTVHHGMVRWLCLGSVPAAFAGVLLLRALGTGPEAQHRMHVALGYALLLAAAGMAAKAVHGIKNPDITELDGADVPVRRLPTLLVGVIGGLVVGLTSVGSGSVVIVLLLALYPRLRARDLVGTDLAQAVPLVAAASVGHLLFGDFRLALTASLLVGALPGVYVGARLSSRHQTRGLRPLLMLVVTASGLRLVGLGPAVLAVTLVGIATAAWFARLWLRARFTPGVARSA